MSIYDEMRVIAQDVMSDEDFKQGTIVYVAITPGSGPADDPGAARETPYELAGGVARGVQFKYVDNSTIVASDLQVTFADTDDFTPEMTGFVTIDGVPHKIMRIVRKPAAGIAVAWTLIVRK